jgi:tetratricopeptide (TPR) repeat protein
MMDKEIYISYAWQGESEAAVDAICAALRARFLEYQRDKESMDYRGSIRAFMESIGRGKFVIAVVGEKYLKSEYCMYESMRMMQAGKHERRVFPIVLDDANLYSTDGKLGYVKFWEARASQLNRDLRELSPAQTVDIAANLRDIGEIQLYLTRFMAFLSDRNLLTPEMHREAGYAQLIKAIEREMAAREDEIPDAPPGSPNRGAALPLDTIPEPAPLPPGSRLPISANPLFTGRAGEFRALAQSLQGGRSIAITTGIGGVGKTQLAAEFAHRYGGYFPGGVFWVSMAEPASIEAEIAACAESAGWAHASLPLEGKVAAARKAWTDAAARLLIFDNCEDAALITKWRPARGGARLLVTSRQQDWEPALGVISLPLGALPRDQSIALLRKFQPGLAEDDPIPNQIAHELGDLPLALHMAGSFLHTYRGAVTPAAYLDQLKSPGLLNHPSMQGRGTQHPPTGHVMHVAKTFALSLDRLDPENETDALALALLTRAAYFAPGEPIPRDLLKATAPPPPEPAAGGTGEGVDKLTVEDALLRLTALGLLEDETGGALKMHRLIAAFVLDHDAAGAGVKPATTDAQTAVEEAVLEAAIRLNNAGFPAPLLAWQAHLRHVTDRAIERQNELAAGLCNTMGYHLQMIAAYAAARPYYEQALAITRQALGEHHPDTARSLNNLGALLQAMGDLPAARPYYEQALAIRKQALGEHHPDTAASLNNLGYLLQAMGDLPAARPYFEQALAITRQALGEHHPDTARSLNNLGYLLQAMGDLPAARPYFEQALAIRKQALGEHHPDTARSLNNLGYLLQAMGDLPAARPYYEQALAIRKQALGEHHPDTARSLNNLGYLLQAMGDLPAARPYFEEALAIYKQALGEHHPDTAASLNNLAILNYYENNFVEAARLMRQALDVWEKRLGANHPQTMAGRETLAVMEEKLRQGRAGWSTDG